MLLNFKQLEGYDSASTRPWASQHSRSCPRGEDMTREQERGGDSAALAGQHVPCAGTLLWGQAGTWQDTAVQALPHRHLDVILVEAWLERHRVKDAITWVQAGEL